MGVPSAVNPLVKILTRTGKGKIVGGSRRVSGGKTASASESGEYSKKEIQKMYIDSMRQRLIDMRQEMKKQGPPAFIFSLLFGTFPFFTAKASYQPVHFN